MNYTKEEFEKMLASNPDLGVDKNNSPEICPLNAPRERVMGSGSNKYHNRETEVNGRVFDSGREAKRAKDLQLMEKAKEIFGLSYQVRIPVANKITWVADFVYLDKNLNPVFEDSKGARTPEYKLKKKLFKEKYNKEITET